MKILLAGSSGFIGSALREKLTAENHETLSLVRRDIRGENEITWNPATEKIDAFPAVDAVINLAGHPIGQRRLTAAERQRILKSREQATALLAKSIADASQKPSVFINASAIGYYGVRGDEQLTETAKPGTSFMAGVVRAWESSAQPAQDAGVRTVMLRTGLVLGKRGGLLKRLLLPFRAGLGGRLANGKQWMSWISIDDEVGAIMHALQNTSVKGAVNLAAPNPVRNSEFTKSLARQLHRPALFPVPQIALSALFGSELAEEFTGSQYVVPQVLTETGYQFANPTLDDAWDDILA